MDIIRKKPKFVVNEQKGERETKHETLAPSTAARSANTTAFRTTRECCALRGGGWGKKHATVDYVFTHPYYWLYAYHTLVMDEMKRRGYQVNALWQQPTYRGEKIGWDTSPFTREMILELRDVVYPEHDARYLRECLDNLKTKGVTLENRKE